MSNPTNSVRLHRVLKTSPDKLYRAFIQPDALAKWLPPYGFTAKCHHLDTSVGGTYLELVPGEKLAYTDKFENPDLPGEMTTTVIIKAVSCGTELSVTQEGIPEMIPAEMCYLGWQESLIQLAKLVEPEIQEG